MTVNDSARGGRVLLTAAEAYPALEQLFLQSEHTIRASFMVFDLTTRLRSPEGLAIGKTWFDLIVHTLRRGVRISMVVSDLDPVMRPRMHRGTWRTIRMFHAAAELADAPHNLDVVPAMHASETGLGVRVLLWPVILRRLARTARWLNRLTPDLRTAALREIPGVAYRLRFRDDGTVRPRFWPVPRLFPGVHHQKIAVFDGRRLYVGGLDLDERRYDSPAHDRPSAQTWHDVQLVIENGPEPSAAEEHLKSFLGIIEGKAEAGPQIGVLRTLSRKRRNQHWHLGPEPVVNELREAHFAAVRGAKRLIYLETQYFRDRGLAKALADAARTNPALTLMLILPGAPDDLAFGRKAGLDVRGGEWLQSRCLRRIEKAFGPRLFIGGPVQRRRWRSDHPLGRDGLHGAPIIYVHAKVSVFDDDCALVSSANLNGRSLRWDTEAGVRLSDPEAVLGLRQRIMAHWLPPDAAPGYFDPARAVGLWNRLALENARLVPERRRGFIVPYDIRKAERDGHVVPLLPEELV
ncbi:MAG: phospholipase D family protein [Gemmobacter sp.]|nr:phospholipase D family protein [Gemmobacter sp.]